MTTTCPRCGKQMDVSQEELSLRDGQVVCPQCLTAYQAVEPSGLSVDQEQLNKRMPLKDVPAHERHYCPNCGEHIEQTINFCPYCGADLNKRSLKAISSDGASQPERVEGEGRRNSHQEGKSKHNSTHSNDNGVEWKPMLPSYGMANRYHNEPASAGFQAIAIAVIIALLALLAFIIYHAMLL